MSERTITLADLTIKLADFKAMSSERRDALTLADIDSLRAQAEAQADDAASVTAALNDILAQRYESRAKEDLRGKGQDFGTARVTTNEGEIKVDIPKRVVWDQKALKPAVDKLGKMLLPGEHLTDYVEFDVKISEAKWKAWPERIKQVFQDARTTKPEKTKFEIRING